MQIIDKKIKNMILERIPTLPKKTKKNFKNTIVKQKVI